jgi:hypothetical protein
MVSLLLELAESTDVALRAAALRCLRHRGSWPPRFDDVGIKTSKPITRPGKHTKNYGKSPFFMGKSTISMTMFNSYVCLPDGNVNPRLDPMVF